MLALLGVIQSPIVAVAFEIAWRYCLASGELSTRADSETGLCYGSTPNCELPICYPQAMTPYCGNVYSRFTSRLQLKPIELL